MSKPNINCEADTIEQEGADCLRLRQAKEKKVLVLIEPLAAYCIASWILTYDSTFQTSLLHLERPCATVVS